MRKAFLAGVVAILLAAVAPTSAQQQSYTPDEYKAYQAAASETVAATKLQKLNGFLEQYPKSALKPYILAEYLKAYQGMKDPPAVISSVDRILAMPDLDANTRLQFIYPRTVNYIQSADGADHAKAYAAAEEGMRIVGGLKPPEGMTAEQFNNQIKPVKMVFLTAMGSAAMAMKDFAGAASAYQQTLALSPDDALTYYRLGVSYLQQNPPSYMDGFWSVARAIALKVPNEASVRQYLRTSVLRYQNTQCDRELDRQVNEMIALAGQGAERPADYTVPSEADLTKARENIATFLETLKNGGGDARVLWLAVCGLEFPDVAVKVIEVTENGESAIMKVYRSKETDPEKAAADMEAATEPNMELNVTGQPEVKRLSKDDFVRFTGTLSGYQPEPFLLSWNQAKINPEDIPAEEAQPGKRTPKRPTKRPGR
jgi:tetratricopeptide (TPR) repeat protein